MFFRFGAFKARSSLLPKYSNFPKMMMVLLILPAVRRLPQEQNRPYITLNKELSLDTMNRFDERIRLVFHQLNAIAPRFLIPASDIEVLTVPSEFYQLLKGKILGAKRRIFLLLLYIGKSQVELVLVIDQALSANPDLEVHILTDALRGTREAPENPCLASLLVPLVEKHGKHRVNIRMYHTPHLSGIAKQLWPRRLNESYGLQHMKLYGFDNETILLGANLLEDYFTDRQDRYYLFRHQDLTDYYFQVHDAISRLLYQLLPLKKRVEGFRLLWPTLNALCDPHINKERFILDSAYLLEPILKKDTSNDDLVVVDSDTIVYAVSQFTPLLHSRNDVSTEKPAIIRLLSYLDLPAITWCFTAGYFNMHPEIQERLVNVKSEGLVITAAPQANLFYKLAGILGYVPEAYLLCAKQFLETIKKAGKENLVKVYEWLNGVVNTSGGWLYHAKGLWISAPGEQDPLITVIGLLNYTKRAYSLDLESNAIVITSNEELKRTMLNEIKNIMTHAKPMKLEEFQPSEHKVKVKGENGEEIEKTEMFIDENRRISLPVHFLYRLFGNSM